MTDDYDVTAAMIRYGGNFVKRLGHLVRAADDVNVARLKETFPAYWRQYAALAERDKSEQAQPENESQ